MNKVTYEQVYQNITNVQTLPYMLFFFYKISKNNLSDGNTNKHVLYNVLSNHPQETLP